MINLSDRERDLIDEICKKHSTKIKPQQQQTKLVSQSSTKILVQRLERRLNETLNEVDEQKLGHITFEQLGRIFTLLEIFQGISYNEQYQLEAQGLNNPMQKQQEVEIHEKAFTILSGGEQTIDIQAAFCFFRIILDPHYLEATKCAILIKEYLEKILGNQFQLQQIEEFCDLFQSYQKTRLAGAKIGYLKASLAQNLIDTYEKTLTFKPIINSISEALQQQPQINENSQHTQSQSSFLGESRVSELYKKQEIANQKIQNLKNEKLTQEMQECTFKPQIISKKKLPNVIDRLYTVKNTKELEERARIAQEERQESEFSKCSFHPQINYALPEQQNTEIKGFERSIQRIRTAIDQRHLRELKLNHKPAGEKYEKVKNMPFIPPEMLNRTKNKKDLPILYIDIKLGPSKVGRLALRKTDNVQEVVQSFCKVWGVNQNDYDTLVTQVQTNLNNIIQEESQEI